MKITVIKNDYSICVVKEFDLEEDVKIFIKIDNPIVVLADLNTRTFKIDEEICIPIYISNFDNLFENCSVEYKMETSNEVLAS